MYLLHFQAIDLSAPFVFKLVPEPSAVAFAVLYTAFVASSYAAAWVLYRLVERPFLAWRDRWRHAALAGAAVPAPSGT
jgi:peptidoglycan/LPS O-acetylase OafA/YrhL